MTPKPEHTNRLIEETSPYLLQHAHNPVDWYPWGEAALERAREEDKPILVSIGYSACHWCHVMERESFEDEEIARFMNEHFINIKIDREERPDLDELYMTAVQLLTGQGGWPLNVFLTPDLKPFYGGTYFPPEDRWGRPGFMTVLQQIAQLYESERSAVVDQADRLIRRLQQITRPGGGATLISSDLLFGAYRQALRSFDPTHGGFGSAPKFPHSMELSLVLRHWRRTGDPDALKLVELSLERMAHGGIYDQLGGGFHRYSTDARWLIPHFEKMLYDNALLTWTYLEAYQATGRSLYRRIVEQTLAYVLREMTDPEGGFYATQDADSPDGEEGGFYTWNPEEIAAVLGEEEGAIVRRYFGVTEEGEGEGEGVLHLPEPAEEVAANVGMTPETLEAQVERAKQKLFQAREKRPKPGRDEKIITAWNGLMISSFARAYQILEDPSYQQAAERAARFCLDRLRTGDRLLRTFKDGQARFNAYLEDYAFLIVALLDLYQTTFDPEWFDEARVLTEMMIDRFWDEAEGGFFFTAEDHESLLVRSKNPNDGATPSGNSAAVFGLLTLAELTGEVDLKRKAEMTLRAFSAQIEQMPNGFSHMLSAVGFLLGPVVEVAIVGDRDAPETRKLVSIIHDSFNPNKVIALRDPDRPEQSDQIALLEGKELVDGKPTVYLCENYTCRAPITEPEELKRALRG